MKKGRATAIIAENKERFFDRMVFVGGEEDFIQPEADPGEDRDGDPDNVEESKEYKAFFCKASRRIGGFDKGAISHTPEKAKVIDHIGESLSVEFLNNSWGILSGAGKLAKSDRQLLKRLP